MAHVGEWVAANQACSGPAGEYLAVLYMPDADSANGITGYQQLLGELDTDGDVERVVTEFERRLPVVVAAYALLRRCYRTKHMTPGVHDVVPSSGRFRLEPADAGVFVDADTSPRSVNLGRSVRGMDADGVSEAVVSRQGGAVLRPVLHMPRGSYDIQRRTGSVIEARSSTPNAPLYVALWPGVRTIRGAAK